MLKAKNPKGKMSLDNYLNLVYKTKFVSKTSVECYGWFSPMEYHRPLHRYTPIRELDGYVSLFSVFHYIEGYDETIGFTSQGYPTPERVICDLLQYPKELASEVYIGDALMEYLEDKEDGYVDLSKVENMMKQLNIPKEALEYGMQFIYEPQG